MGGPKNNNYFWTQWVRLRRYGLKKIQFGFFKGLKPIISGLSRKCVGGPKNNNYVWTQGVRLRRYELKKIQFGLFKGLKPIISGFTGNAWADWKSDVTIVSTIIDSLHKHDLTRTLYKILQDIAFFRFTSGFPRTSGHRRKFLYPLCTSPNLPLHVTKKFGFLSCFPQEEIAKN